MSREEISDRKTLLLAIEETLRSGGAWTLPTLKTAMEDRFRIREGFKWPKNRASLLKGVALKVGFVKRGGAIFPLYAHPEHGDSVIGFRRVVYGQTLAPSVVAPRPSTSEHLRPVVQDALNDGMHTLGGIIDYVFQRDPGRIIKLTVMDILQAVSLIPDDKLYDDAACARDKIISDAIPEYVTVEFYPSPIGRRKGMRCIRSFDDLEEVVLEIISDGGEWTSKRICTEIYEKYGTNHTLRINTLRVTKILKRLGVPYEKKRVGTSTLNHYHLPSGEEVEV